MNRLPETGFLRLPQIIGDWTPKVYASERVD